MLTISRLRRWSIDYYNRTADQARRSATDRQAANGGLGEYYTEADTRTPTWVLAGDVAAVAGLTGLDAAAIAGGFADTAEVARWLDDGIAPSGARGRGFGRESVHGFDLVFAAPKSVSLARALSADGVNEKAVAQAHAIAVGAAMTYLAEHAGYTRVHNPVTGMKDLQRLPGLLGIAYQHETSRCGDPHLHTHLIVPNRQPRADGVLVSIDSKSLHHEAKAAGVIYQAVLRHELHATRAMEWAPVDPNSGMAEIAGVTKECITAYSQRSTQLRDWAANRLVVVDGLPTAAQLATAQKATRPVKPESLSWEQLTEGWRADGRGLQIDPNAHYAARAARQSVPLTFRDHPVHQMSDQPVSPTCGQSVPPGSGGWSVPPTSDQPVAPGCGQSVPPGLGGWSVSPTVSQMAARIGKAVVTRADMVELIGAQLPVDAPGDPRTLIEHLVDQVSVRVSGPREAHHREGHVTYTVAAVIAEEERILGMVDTTEGGSQLWPKPEDLAELSPGQARAVAAIARSTHLVQPLQAPAGAGKTHSLQALRAAAHRAGKDVLVVAPTGKAVDEAMRGGAGDRGLTVAKALHLLDTEQLAFTRATLVIVDEASMLATPDLATLLAHANTGRAKMVLVGDPYQLAPVRARGGMFEQLCTELPWAQHLSEVWRMRNPEERHASLALRRARGNHLRTAVGWYRTQGRLHTGDPVAMATDARDAYRAAHADGADVAILCDTWEMADAINRQLHDTYTEAGAPSVPAARGQHIRRGDLIISRHNDTTVEVNRGPDHKPGQHVDQVRNGNRWRVVGVDDKSGRIGAERVSDRARAVFRADYVREHITWGYAATVHSAQGITIGTSGRRGVCWSILSTNATRAMAYVAATRATDDNHLAIYQPTTGEADHDHTPPSGGDTLHLLRRGTKYSAAHHLQTILGNDDRPRTLHTEAEHTERQHLPAEVAEALDRNDQRRAARREVWRHDKARERAYAEAYEQMVNTFCGAEQSRERGRVQEADGLEL